MATSCDVYFYRLGMSVGLDVLAETARKYGFGEKSGLGFAESPGFIPDKEFYKKQNNGYYPAGQDLNNAIGQGDVKVTMLQLALAYGAIANGGYLMQPQMGRRIGTTDGKLGKGFPPIVRRHTGGKPEINKLVIGAIAAVAQASCGTAH